MAQKPLLYPEWASHDVRDPNTQQYNVVEPPQERKDVGWIIEKPPRQWFNWLFRTIYDWIMWLDQQESLTVVSDASGVGLYKDDDSMITIKAIDLNNVNNYYSATGIKVAGQPPSFSPSSIVSNGLTLGVGTASGDQPINGGTNVIISATSRYL